MYKERALVKKDDSVLGDLYKLIMNSSYGKTCEKEKDSSIRITTQNEFGTKYNDDNVT